MAKSPLPIIFAVGALLYLRSKGEDEEEVSETTGKPKTPDTKGADDGAGDSTDDSTESTDSGDNAADDPELEDGLVDVVPKPAPGLNPGGTTNPPVAADTSGPSGYNYTTIGQMMIIQSQLAQLGYDPGKIDGKWSYNGNTFGAVSDFQTNYGLTVDGKPGSNTQSTLEAVAEGTWVPPGPPSQDPADPSGYSDLTVGQMKNIQSQLAQLGYDPGEIDGKWIYGGNTYDAVREFQYAYGLQVDGKPGPNTQTMIDVAIDDPAPSDPDVDPLPDPAPVNDPSLFVIGTKLTDILSHPDFKKPMTLVEQVRSTGLGKPEGFAYGYDIYQDQRTLGGDGRFIGVAMAKTDDAESFVRLYRGSPTATIASSSGRVNELAEKFEYVIGVLKDDMT